MSYTGEIAEIPVGFGGLTGSRNQTQIRPDQLLIAQNISYDTGNISKEGGALLYNSDPTNIPSSVNIIGGWDWWPSIGVQRMVVMTSGGALLGDEGSGFFGTTFASGFNVTVADTVPFFVEGGKETAIATRKLFVFTGLNPVHVISGSSLTAAFYTNPPADWTGATQPTFGLIHGDRLWGGGNGNDPHRLYYSSPTNHEDMLGVGSGSLSVYPGEGEKLVGAVSFKGLIVAFKYPKGIYLVDTSDPTVANWKVKRMTRGVGCVSSYGAVEIDDDILFIDASGNFQLLSAVTEFGDMANRNLSTACSLNTFMRANINFARMQQVRSVYYPFKREAHFALPGISSAVLNTRIIWDFNVQGQPRARFSNRDANHALWMRKDSSAILKPMIGSSLGSVYYLDQPQKNKDGLAYTSIFQTAHLDFSWIDPKLATKRKLGQFLEIVVEPTGNWTLAVDIMWDGVVKDTVQFSMGSGGAVLGQFVLGTDKLSGNEILNKIKKMSGSGKRLSLIGRSSGVNNDFSISRFYVYFKPGDERLKIG